MEQNYANLKVKEQKFHMDLGDVSFTEEEISEAFEGLQVSEEICKQELYPIH